MKDHYCLNYLAEVAGTRGLAAAKMARAALGGWREMLGGQALSSPVFQRLFTGIEKAKARPPVQRKPWSKSLLRRLWESCLPWSTLSFRDLRNLTLQFTLFMGCLRFSDIINLRWDQVSISEEGVELRCGKRKNDQALKRPLQVLLRNGRSISLSEVFLELRKRGKSGRVFPSRPNAPSCVSYQAAREDLKRCLRRLGIAEEGFGLHSGRVGGIQWLVDCGVPEEDIARLAGYAPGSSSVQYYARNASRGVSNCRNLLMFK